MANLQVNRLSASLQKPLTHSPCRTSAAMSATTYMEHSPCRKSAAIVASTYLLRKCRKRSCLHLQASVQPRATPPKHESPSHSNCAGVRPAVSKNETELQATCAAAKVQCAMFFIAQLSSTCTYNDTPAVKHCHLQLQVATARQHPLHLLL